MRVPLLLLTLLAFAIALESCSNDADFGCNDSRVERCASGGILRACRVYDSDQFFYDVNGERFYCDSEFDEDCLSDARAKCDPVDERL